MSVHHPDARVVAARDIHEIEQPLSELASDLETIASIRDGIRAGDVVIVRNQFDVGRLEEFRDYLAAVGRSSLPNYVAIREGAPNSHRMNRWDPRSYVQGGFHQFSFFPWNQDLFDVFGWFRSAYQVKNLISGLPPDRFLSMAPDDGCIARVSAQFYPCGGGGLNLHVDPVDHHQLTVPLLQLSTKGVDFMTGGAHVQNADGELIDLEARTSLGDLVFFNAQTPHSVEPIDPGHDLAWHRFEGRWVAVLAVNRLATNPTVGDSVDLASHE